MVGIAHPLSASVLVDGSALAGAMPPLRLLHSGIDKKQSLPRPGLAKNIRPIVEQAAELAADSMVLYIDKHRLGRDCISEQLASQLSQWTVESLASMSELKRRGAGPTSLSWFCTLIAQASALLRSSAKSR
jgi:hypothetical protein